MPLYLMHPGFAFLSTGAQLHLKAEKQKNTSVVQQESDTQSQKKSLWSDLELVEMDVAGLVVTWRVLLSLCKALNFPSGRGH